MVREQSAGKRGPSAPGASVAFVRLRWSSTASSPLAEKLRSAGKFSPSTTPTITYYCGPPKGQHRLVVYLVNNDDTNTDISATSIFTVK